MSASGEPTPEKEWPWLCALTKPRQEEYAAQHLQRQGIEVFLPRLKSRQVRRGEVVWQVGPMFPRYVFLRPKASDVVGRIRSTRGVVKLVSFGNRPAEVPKEVIEWLREKCREEGWVAQAPDFKPGERVRILTGPYAGMEAIFERETSRQERVIILLEIMATVARVKIDRNQLVAAVVAG